MSARSSLKRKTPLRRTGGLKRSPMKRRNPERAAKRREKAFGEQAALCRTLPCVICSTEPTGVEPTLSEWVAFLAEGHTSEPHHVPTRGAGGVDKDTVPLCRTHHREWHDIGEQSFDAKYGVNLRAVAKAIHDELKAAQNVAQGMEQSDDE